MKYVYMIALSNGTLYSHDVVYTSHAVAEANRKRYVWPEAFRVVELPVVDHSQYSPLPPKEAPNAPAR